MATKYKENLDFFDSWKCSILDKTNRFSSDIKIPAIPLKENHIDKEKILDILRNEEYGYIDDSGVTYSVNEVEFEEEVMAGKGYYKNLEFTFNKGDKKASFNVKYYHPYINNVIPTVIQLNFFKDVPSRYTPIEELLDKKIAIAHIFYEEVSSDDDDFNSGLAPLLTNRENMDAAGKLSIWAYAAIKVGEYLLEKGFATKGHLYVAGHSRLGKTALWTAAQSDIFAGVLSNCSGCSGAAIFREKGGETIEKIVDVFPFWFCKNFFKYVNKENDLPFDQHFLLSAIYPKKLCVVTAEKDEWADTDAQHLCVQLASNVYKMEGKKGLKKGKLLKFDEFDEGGDICFSKRKGTHFFSRADWAFFIRNID